ncbi:RecQ family ATP-dependent DNA helicase [Shouchella shacheensis]|uniref:RecQ family ATP-dependent DNA helicase n=1 Tax=Shouchella shacheensis TaxID=1649580 RepID=UPI00073FEA3D|nr:ATP-dependent DNA helicase RecQ [Shouchella shacheensis]
MLEQALRTHFGYDSFKPGQEEIIEALLSRQNVLAMLPTGTGKSLCYQLPALVTEGLTIVVSPLLSLMEDQVQQLRSSGMKRVASFNSFQTREERKRTSSLLPQLDLLYTSPEMLQSKWLLERLEHVTVAHFVVDEAHCISHWGHDFRADYLRLKQVKKQLGDPPCLAITATATPRVREDICEQLDLRHRLDVIHSVNRSNIYLQVEQHERTMAKLERLSLLVGTLQHPGLVYVQSRRQSEELASRLKETHPHLRVSHYHGGMENADRLLIQQQFMADQLDLICCTSAFGMGLNKPDIRFVIHYHYSLDMASYIQEIGRAGRDGGPSLALLLSTPEDVGQAKAMLERGRLQASDLDWLLAPLQEGEALADDWFEQRFEAFGAGNGMWKSIRFLLEQLGAINEGVVQPLDRYALTEALAQKLTNRYAEREERLRAFLSWTERTACRREGMLRYFNEEPLSQHPCCDKCGGDLTLFQAKEKNHRPDRFSWQEELALLFGEREEQRDGGPYS